MSERALAWLVGAALAAAACGRSAPELADPTAASGAAGTAGDSSGVGGSAGSAGVGGTSDTGGTIDPGGTGNDPCEGQPALADQRIVRLSFDQVAVALRDLMGRDVAQEISTAHELPTLEERSFPPLQSSREGSLVTDGVFQLGDGVAQAVAKHVLENFDAMTGCGSNPADACAQGFVLDFARRAFRRPLRASEGANLDAVYAEAKSFGGSVEQATQHGVYAVLVSPHFVYRSELGDSGGATNTSLTLYEAASLLAFFLTNGPPDGELLDSAAAGTLLDESVLEDHVERLLELPETRKNFETALVSYLGIYALPGLALDPDVADTRIVGFGMRNSMVREAELFLEDHLWDGSPTADLLLSRRGRVNSTLATIYGPEVAATVDPDPNVFAEMTLPEARAGLLTMPGFLTVHVRPEAAAVTSRGLLVNALIACQANPPEHPPDSSPTNPTPGVTQRAAADARALEPGCAGCHTSFDGYGLALERFDSIGRYRTTDAEGRPIDPVVPIPVTPGTVLGAAGLAEALSHSDIWGACLAQTLLRFALAEPTASDVGSLCGAREIVKEHADGDGSFRSLVREIARSRALFTRVRGEL